MRYILAMLLMLTGSTAWAGFSSINENGIDSLFLGLDGTGVLIGEVDGGRSGKQGYDGDGFAASNTTPTGVYHGIFFGMDDPNSFNITDHATEVAQVMIGKLGPGEIGATWEGVAPNAQLHSIAIDSDFELALNRAATLNGGAVRATNLSAGLPLDFFEAEDGNSHLTQFVDWSASFHDVLYVVAWGNIDTDEFRKPEDNFNGITVAASERTEGGGDVYKRYSVNINASSGDASGDRTSIDLLAPGKDIHLLRASDEADSLHDGTSFATPHVSGAVALLQQYAQTQIDPPISNPRFTTNSQRHEVMKAVLLNSADKMAGVHGSNRTVLDGNDFDWTQSEAFNSQFISLDNQMGAGALNVRQAKQQFSSGEYNPGTVPLIGWDYGTIGGPGAIQEYYFDQNLEADKYIAITLTWDRKVEKTSPGSYNEGDEFFHYDQVDEILNNLDVYLMPAGSNDLVIDSIWASRTFEDNVEHIFFSNFGAGAYKIVVNHNTVGTLGTSQNYALAWWYGSDTPPPNQGDFNGDGSVNGADYVIWRKNDGTSYGYNLWRSHFGETVGSGSVLGAVPEPSSWLLIAIGVLLAGRVRRRDWGCFAFATK